MSHVPVTKKIFLVNRDFQFRYTFAGLAAGCVSTLITATAILYPLYAFKILTIGIYLPWPIFVAMGAAVFFNILVQFAFGILLTHKVAGPMFSLIKNIRKLAAGQWNLKMQTRAGDDLQMIVRHLNELSENMVRATQADLNHLAIISEAIVAMECNPIQKSALMKSIDELSQRMSARIDSPKSSGS